MILIGVIATPASGRWRIGWNRRPPPSAFLLPFPAAGESRGEGGRPQVFNTPARRLTTRPFESLRALANWLEQMTAAVGVFAPLHAAGEGRGEGGRPEVLNTPARRPTTWPFESLRALALGG